MFEPAFGEAAGQPVAGRPVSGKAIDTVSFPILAVVHDAIHATRVWKTHTRQVATLRIGHFIAHETQGYCPHCVNRPVFLAEELHQLVPPGARYGYDVIVHVGKALFLRCRNGKEIQQELGEKNIDISLREIDCLGRRFIVYLALVHGQSHDKLKQFMGSVGGYILHLDGTCEGDSPHLMSTIDGLSKIVLDNIKIPSENAAQLIPFLRTIKRAYGEPIAMVHDMGKGYFECHQGGLSKNTRLHLSFSLSQRYR